MDALQEALQKFIAILNELKPIDRLLFIEGVIAMLDPIGQAIITNANEKP